MQFATVWLMSLGATARFLVVEDYAPCARCVARILNPFGEVAICARAADARRDIDARHSAGYVVDIGLPDGSGFDLIERVRRKQQTSSVVVLSGTVSRA